MDDGYRLNILERKVDQLSMMFAMGAHLKIEETILKDMEFMAKLVDCINALQLKKE